MMENHQVRFFGGKGRVIPSGYPVLEKKDEKTEFYVPGFDSNIISLWML